MKPIRAIVGGAAALVIAVSLMYLTPAPRSLMQVARDRAYGREEKGRAFERVVGVQRIAYSTLGILGLGALALGTRRHHLERNA